MGFSFYDKATASHICPKQTQCFNNLRKEGHVQLTAASVEEVPYCSHSNKACVRKDHLSRATASSCLDKTTKGFEERKEEATVSSQSTIFGHQLEIIR